MTEYDGKLRVVYKNFVVHPDTVLTAHLAGCAAGKQGKFSEYKKVFWDKGFGEYAKTRDPKTMGEDSILAMAGEIGLDKDKLVVDMKGEACQGRIKADMQELSKFGVGATPSFFVNGKFTMFSGVAAFKTIIDAELAEAEASGVAAADYYNSEVLVKGEKTFVSKADRKKATSAPK